MSEAGSCNPMIVEGIQRLDAEYARLNVIQRHGIRAWRAMTEEVALRRTGADAKIGIGCGGKMEDTQILRLFSEGTGCLNFKQRS